MIELKRDPFLETPLEVSPPQVPVPAPVAVELTCSGDPPRAERAVGSLGDWAGTDLLVRVADGSPGPDCSVWVILGRGIEGARREVLRARRAGWDVAVVVVCPIAGAQDRQELRSAGAGAVVELKEDGSFSDSGLAAAIRWANERRLLRGDLERARELGQHLAHHDGLTGLPNRMYFRNQLGQVLAEAKRHHRRFAVLFVDLDRFKQVNDSFGHAVGDQVLAEVARRIEGCVRESDFVARSGGDEFQVILTDIRRGQDAARVARKICGAIASPLNVEGTEVLPTASIGISLFPADGDNEDTLVKHADAAMYQAKHGGRAGFRFYLPQMTDKALERLALESRLRTALEREEFCLHYQPRVDLGSGRIRGVEALVRWQHPDLGLVYPDEFIPVAEETGLIGQLGDWVALEACRQLAAWHREGLELDSIAINVSARQFELGSVARSVTYALEQASLDPNRLEVEITESAVMENAGRAIDTLRGLRDLGVGIAVDDFGTGHSSLAYLKDFPITKLKIDKAFVRYLPGDGKDFAIVRAIIQMAHSLGLTVCAEGVETEEVLELLREPRCDEVQGYVYSPPVAPDRLADLLRRN